MRVPALSSDHFELCRRFVAEEAEKTGDERIEAADKGRAKSHNDAADSVPATHSGGRALWRRRQAVGQSCGRSSAVPK